MYLNQQEQFLHTAKFWTETYARPEASHEEVSGFKEEKSWVARLQWVLCEEALAIQPFASRQ